MKRLNKITLILVAVMGIVISGCGGDIKKAPFVQIIARSNYIAINLIEPCDNTDFYKTNKAIEKCFAEWDWDKMKKTKLVKLKGRRDCSNLSIKYYADDNYFKIEPSKDCPPKNRLNDKSYELTIKTNYGTFRYDTNNKKSEWKIRSGSVVYAPIK